ncbi:uncharacterized protein LOC126380944 [Pectinophora gossypiella]|uniref:uncharacterized protein LOC126380944 n=1 Tax=Pectinophora gossypiella TaxID=13191 RepID=UPI00214EED20|nr:uncharacterized protein LOC126380944 [Pectinophora gossypiella]
MKFSQSTGKLDPGMRGPYKVIEVLPSGRYVLRLLSGGYGKTTQAAAQHMVLWRGEWCPESCTAFFEDENVNDDETSPAGPSYIASPIPVLDDDETTSAGNARAADPSMPLLDDDMDAGPAAPGVAGPSTLRDCVEDDTLSGEAV